MEKLKARLLLFGSNPIVAWLVRQFTTCGVAYLGLHPFTPVGWQTWAINGLVFIVAGTVHAFDIWLQTRVANAPAVTTAPSNPASVAPAQSHLQMLKASLKMVLFLMGTAFLFASSASAGYFLTTSNNSEKFGIAEPSGPVDGVYALPIAEFQVGSNLPVPTYGVAITEDLVWGRLTPAAGGVNMAPYLGIGASLYADTAGVINGNGPLQLLGGLNVIGPDLDLLGLGNGQGLVPAGQMVYNFQTGERQITGGLTVFLDIFPTVTIQKIF